MDALLIAVFGGVGVAVVELIKFILGHRYEKTDAVDGINRKIDKLHETVNAGFRLVDERFEALEYDIDERQAKNTRVRILRYADELMEGRKHSKESYDQTLVDIDDYERFCDRHPDFENNRTTLAAQRIKDIYKRRMEKQDFL